MAGVTRQTASKVLLLLRDTTARGADTTTNLIPIWSSLGWGVLRIFVESDVAGTLNILEKARNGTFRRTFQQSIAAATGTAIEKTLVGEYLRIQYVVGGTAQARMEMTAALYP